MSINLLKRLESSVYAFRLTIDRISKLIEDTMQSVRSYQNGSRVLELNDISDATDWDDDDQNNDIFTVGRKVKIDLADMDHVSWLHDLERMLKIWSFFPDGAGYHPCIRCQAARIAAPD